MINKLDHYNKYKKAKQQLIVKYKKNIGRTNKNEDQFISINDFLAVEMSAGPKENPGNISYHYQMYTNIYNYVRLLIRKCDFARILCSPNFVLKFKKYIDKTAIVYYIDEDYLIIPEKLSKKIFKCIENKDIRFIYFVLMIDNTDLTIGLNHCNIIVIDVFLKTIERFEPHGHFYYPDKNGKYQSQEDKINSAIKNRLIDIIGLNEYKYITPFDMSPMLGPQAKADAYNGMCITFCLLYLQLRIMNPDVKQSELIDYLLSKSKQKLKNMVLRYAKFVEISLKNNENEIYNTNHEINKEYNKIQTYIFAYNNKNVRVDL